MTKRDVVELAAKIFCESCEKTGCDKKCVRYNAFYSMLKEDSGLNAEYERRKGRMNSRYHRDEQYREECKAKSRKWTAEHKEYKAWYDSHRHNGVSVTFKEWKRMKDEGLI